MAVGPAGPRKMGVYRGAGTVRAQARTVQLVIAAIVVALVLLVLFH